MTADLIPGEALKVNDVVFDRAGRGPWHVTEVKVTYCGVRCLKVTNRQTGAVLHYPVTALFERAAVSV